MGKNNFIQIHTVRNFGSCNLNRDADGNPKTCIYSDWLASRISSQCLKRAIRIYLDGIYGRDAFGVRTRNIDKLVFEELNRRGDFDSYKDDLSKDLMKLGQNQDKDDKKSNKDSRVNQYYSMTDVRAICDIIEQYISENGSVKGLSIEKKLAANNIRPINYGIALFGRMAATKSFSTVESSVQFMHSMSSNKIRLESDYFTSIDDIVSDGAAHLGEKEFNSPCYYNYANIDIDAFRSNLDGNLDGKGGIEDGYTEEYLYRIVSDFIRAFCIVTPSGMQNSFASYPPPSIIMIEVNDRKTPVNYQAAFATPISATSENNLVEGTSIALSDYVDKVDVGYPTDYKPNKRYWFNLDGKKGIKPEHAIECSSLDELLEKVISDIKGE